MTSSPTTPAPQGEPSAETARCKICGWPLAATAEEGCVPGNCSYRPEQGSPEYYRIEARRKAPAATPAPATSAPPAEGGGALRKALQRLSDAVTNLGRGRTESGRNFFEGSPTQDPGVYEAWLELNKAQVEAARALAARSTDGWRTIDSAPKGRDHPYKKSPDAEPATFVVVWNGFHQGIAYCEIDYGDTEQWWDEGGDPVEPPPFKWHPLLPNPLPEPPSSEVK